MAIAIITEEQRKLIMDEFKYTEDTMHTKILQMKDWLKKQPHMPKIPESIFDRLILFYLNGTKMNTEKAKRKLDTAYAIRHQLPEIFCEIDPASQSIRDSVDMISFVPVSELTPDGIRITITSFTFENDQKFTVKDLNGYFKRIMAIGYVRMVVQNDFVRGEYIVIDARGFYLSHLTELSWSLLLKISKLIQEGFPIIIKGVYVINAPTYFETALNILKPAIKEKIRKRIHIFQGDHTNLYKFMPQRILPSDYGGEAPSIKESNRAWQKTIESQRDLLMEEEKRVTDESKRLHNSYNGCDQTFGISGTFTKLNID